MTAFSTGTARVQPSWAHGVHPDRNARRGPLGRFLPDNARRDELGRRLVTLDLRDVERRLKARPRRED